MAHDRAIGALCIGLAAAVAAAALVVAAPSSPTEPERTPDATVELGPTDDPDTTAAFLDLYARAQQTPRVLDARWERRRGGELRLESSWREVTDGAGNRLVEAHGSLTGVYDGQLVVCSADDDGAHLCRREPAPDHEDELDARMRIAAEVTAPRTGVYTVARAPERTVIGEATECFVLRRRPGRAGWAFGASTTMCYSEAAAPLLVERREGDVVDTRRATSVSFEVDAPDFEELLGARADALALTSLRSPP